MKEPDLVRRTGEERPCSVKRAGIEVTPFACMVERPSLASQVRTLADGGGRRKSVTRRAVDGDGKGTQAAAAGGRRSAPRPGRGRAVRRAVRLRGSSASGTSASPPTAISATSPGLLLALGLCFWGTIPRIEERRPPFRFLTVIVVIGGLSRLVGLVLTGLPSLAMFGGLAMELIVTPLLCLWQTRVAHRCRGRGVPMPAEEA